jgi:hypothetical protein
MSKNLPHAGTKAGIVVIAAAPSRARIYRGAGACAGAIPRVPAGSPRRGRAGHNRRASCSGSGGRPRTSTGNPARARKAITAENSEVEPSSPGAVKRVSFSQQLTAHWRSLPHSRNSPRLPHRPQSTLLGHSASHSERLFLPLTGHRAGHRVIVLRGDSGLSAPYCRCSAIKGSP